MAIVTGGDIKELSWSNPELGSGFVFFVAGADSTFNLGGYRGNDQPVLDTAGRLLVQMNLQPWSFQCEASNDMADSKEFDTMSALAGSTSETTWTVAHKNGKVYRGQGVILGALELNGNKSSFMLKVTGGGLLEMQ